MGTDYGSSGFDDNGGMRRMRRLRLARVGHIPLNSALPAVGPGHGRNQRNQLVELWEDGGFDRLGSLTRVRPEVGDVVRVRLPGTARNATWSKWRVVRVEEARPGRRPMRAIVEAVG